MKRAYFLVLLCFLSITQVRCDEGMWFFPHIDKERYEIMKQKGLKLSEKDIYCKDSCLKDAVVIFGGICTGEIISDQGLLLTNHHCGFGYVQELSTVENNYLENGFWAMKKEEEIPCPGLTVSFLEDIKDVTEEILADVNDTLTETERDAVIQAKQDEIISESTYDTTNNKNYTVKIKSFFEGNQFFLIRYKEYMDVRLVGVPPGDIGKYGGDTDNWMWPRHTGDFALFRVYSDPEGEPATCDTNNNPYRPKHYFPVSIDGIEENDFSMIMGFPGRTDRYWTSYQVNEQLTIDHPLRIKVRGLRQLILKEQMEKSDTIYIKYASKYSRSSNYWKYSIGQSKWLRKNEVVRQKNEVEEKFKEWLSKNNDQAEKFGNALNLIKESVEKRDSARHAYLYINEAIFRSAEMIDLASSAYNFYNTLKNENASETEINSVASELKNEANEFYKNYDKETDKMVTKAMLKLFYQDVNKSFHPEIIQEIESRYKLDFDKYVDRLYKKSFFVSRESLYDFLEKPKLRKLKKDMAFVAAKSFYNTFTSLVDNLEKLNIHYRKGERLYMEGLMNMFKDSTFYSNANFTMRLTYGTVGGYEPSDAVYYNYYTTLKGVIEKRDEDDPDFNVPEKLVSLYKEKEYSPYGDKELFVNFITNNDITGGNSGSPVINGKGELIGVAFDGNWESMSGDIQFVQDKQRAIAVDIRYILFILDKFAKADHLIKEMSIKH